MRSFSPGGIQQEVVVQEALPVVEPEKTQQSDTITQERIENLPINERNFLNFSLLTPGVTDSNGLVTFTLPQTAFSGLSFLGQGGRSNNVSIDGVDNNDNAVAGVRSTMSQEAVQEFQINRSSFLGECRPRFRRARSISFRREPTTIRQCMSPRSIP